MPSGLIVLDSVDALERVIVVSEERLVLLFKHSVTCDISAQAHDALVTYFSDGKHTAQPAIVTVQTHPDVSDAVATRLNVRHETPQVILIQEGRMVWEASHFYVTAQTIKDAIDRHSSS